MSFIKKKIWLLIVLIVFFLSDAALANIVITGTRVIYPSNEQEVDVKLNNVGTYPLLVQTWLDKGNSKSQPDEVKVPFVLTPPVFRLDAKKGQTLRLMYTQEPLPQNKESLFWLNVLEIPPKPATSTGKNWLQIAFRTRIKVFFRPEQLNKQSQLKAAPAQITWQVKNTAKGYILIAKNPTPYFINLTNFVFLIDNKKQLPQTADMLEPFSQKIFSLKNALNKSTGTLKISFTSIDDWGAPVITESPIFH